MDTRVLRCAVWYWTRQQRQALVIKAKRGAEQAKIRGKESSAVARISPWSWR
jgi:hypothetical protein